MCYNKQSPRSLAESEAMAKAVGRRGRDVIAQGPPAVKVWRAFSLGRHRHIEIPLLRQGA